MIPVPHTYADWVEVLEAFKNKTNDFDVLNSMKNGTIDWQSGVAERFSSKLIEAVNHRLNAASDKFRLEISRAGGQENAVIQAILNLRKEMSFLAQAINLPALPDKYRQLYRNIVVDRANEIQKNLEDSAKGDRTGKLASIVRNHRINML